MLAPTFAERRWVPCPRLSWACFPENYAAWPRKRGHGTRYTQVRCALVSVAETMIGGNSNVYGDREEGSPYGDTFFGGDKPGR
jgi:hypothetical protein